jgi:tetratricopeptide (TPR) repeat protein
MIQHGVAIAEQAGLADERARLSRDLCWAYLLDGRLDDAHRQIDETLVELDRLGHRAAVADVYMGARFFRGRVLYESDRFREAEEFSRETYALALEAHNLTVQAASSSMTASALVLQGRYAESIEWATQALEVGRRIESLPAVRAAMASRLIARAATGGAGASAEELDALAGGLLTAGDMGLTVDQILGALIDVGELERAHAVSVLYASRAGGRLREARIALTRGEVALARCGMTGCAAPAERDLRDAIELGTAIGVRSIVGRAELGLARIALARGQTKKGVAYARAAAEIFTTLGLGHYAPRALALVADPGEPRIGLTSHLDAAS